MLSSDLEKGVDINVKSGVFKNPFTSESKAPVVTPTELINGSWPSVTPVTVATPVTEILDVPTSVILTIDFKSLSKPPKVSKLPTLSLLGNNGFPHVIVLKPVFPLTTVIVASPKLNKSCWTTSATKLFADPTFPRLGPAYNDLTSLIPNDVTAKAILLFSSPLIINGSFGTKSPDLSYIDKDVVLLAFDLKNPVAPLNLPFIKAGVLNVIAWFNVTLVNVWTSKSDISYSLIFELVALYDPDSKTKSYTLATPISDPTIDPPVGKPSDLWSLKLTTNVLPIPTSGDPVCLLSVNVAPVL